MTSTRPDGHVEFRFFRLNAQEVKVLGNFNGWAGDSLLMTTAGDGWWTTEAVLDGGEYRFRYWADGHWYTDFAANGIEQSRHGWNSILIIPERSMSATQMVQQNTAKLAA